MLIWSGSCYIFTLWWVCDKDVECRSDMLLKRNNILKSDNEWKSLLNYYWMSGQQIGLLHLKSYYLPYFTEFNFGFRNDTHTGFFCNAWSELTAGCTKLFAFNMKCIRLYILAALWVPMSACIVLHNLLHRKTKTCGTYQNQCKRSWITTS